MGARSPFFVRRGSPRCRAPIRPRRFPRYRMPDRRRLARRRRRLRARHCPGATGDVRPAPLQPDAARGSPRRAAAGARSPVADNAARRAGRGGAGALRCDEDGPAGALYVLCAGRRIRPDSRARWRERSRSWRWRWCRSRLFGGPATAAAISRRCSSDSTSSSRRRRLSIGRGFSPPPRVRRPNARTPTRAAACC